MGSEALRQIAFADRVLINKIDLVGSRERSRIADLVRSINPDAKCIEASHSRVSLEDILDIKTFDAKKSFQVMKNEAGIGPDLNDNTTIKQSKGFSFLPLNAEGGIDLSAKSRPFGKFNTADADSSAHSSIENVSTVSLTLPTSEPLDINNLNL